jgi:hypothetical protein
MAGPIGGPLDKPRRAAKPSPSPTALSDFSSAALTQPLPNYTRLVSQVRRYSESREVKEHNCESQKKCAQERD